MRELAGGGASRAGGDEPNGKWLTELMRGMWPKVNEYVEKEILEEWLEPLIKEGIPVVGPTFRFTRKSLGRVSPQMGPIVSRVRDLRGGSAVEWKVPVQYHGDCDIQAVGLLVVYLRPFVPTLPFAGGIEIAFLDPPVVDMDFELAGPVSSLIGRLRGSHEPTDPLGLRHRVVGAIRDAFTSSMVLPARMALHLDRTGRGVLRVTVHGASRLAAADLGGMSDPYVVATTLDPQWGRDGGELDFLVYDDEQGIGLEVFDHDVVGADDFLGCVPARPIRALLDASPHPVPFPLCDHDGSRCEGELTVSCAWLPIHGADQGWHAAERPDPPTPGATACGAGGGAAPVLVTVRIDCITGLPRQPADPGYWQVRAAVRVPAHATPPPPQLSWC
eukprot:gene41706-43566_t